MLGSHNEKQLTTREQAEKKVEAWKTINSVLVKKNANFMNNLHRVLEEKEKAHKELEEKLKDGKGSADDNAEYLFMGGYVKCLKDILSGGQS